MSIDQAPPGWGAFGHSVYKERYSLDGKEVWEDTADRVCDSVFGPVIDRPQARELREAARLFIAQRKLMPGGRYLHAAGRPFHQIQNCLLTMVEDSREGWADHYHKHMMGLSTGAGMGAVYSKLRPRGCALKRTGGISSGPIPLMIAINEVGRGTRAGGDRRSALWAGLHWWHANMPEFLRIKNWSPEVRALKAKDFDFPAPMDGTNISNCLDDEFFTAYYEPDYFRRDEWHGNITRERAHDTYWTTVRQMLKTGEPGFSVDVGENAGEWLRNACTEVSSRDDSDICNIASINLARVETIEEFRELVFVSTGLLLAGTVYSDLPYEKVYHIREKNRRLGLGLLGVHEWLLKRGKKYGPDAELALWLDEYAKSTEIAHRLADAWGISRPVKTRAMAPNGTIGIVAETTTCLEPLMAVAYKRRRKRGDDTVTEYVIDPCAQRLIESGINERDIETAYSLADTMEGIERRVAFQAWFQQYVDHGIASTINLPAWGSAINNEDTVAPFGEMLLRYLPKLRGITVYPDGARGGQPITQVAYKTALKHLGQSVIEQGDICDIRGGGSCGA